MQTFSDLDVLFLIPPVFRIMGKKWDAYPLGVGYLVSTLGHQGIKSAIYHANYLEVDECPPEEYFTQYMSEQWATYYSTVKDPSCKIWDELRVVLEKTNPKIVGISSCIVDVPSTYMVIDCIKKYNKDIIVMVGGPSATTYSEHLITNPLIDYLVLGEGERTVGELIPFLLTGDRNPIHIKGIMYQDRGWTVKTGMRDLIQNLDGIPFPNRDKLFYVNPEGELQNIYLTSDILLSRGCPYNCKFCSAFVVWGTRKPRSRTNENILKEITELKNKYGQTHFIFWDDLFTAYRSRVVELCNALIERNLKITFACLARIDTVDTELLTLMKRAGCVEVQFGIESGTDRILSSINKKITVSQILKKAEEVRQSGITWRIFLIIGFPTEIEEEIQKTMEFIDQLQPDSVDLSIFAPYPGTELYSELDKAGRITNGVERSDTSCFERNYTGTIPEERFKEIAVNAFRKVAQYNNLKRGFGKRIGMKVLFMINHLRKRT